MKHTTLSVLLTLLFASSAIVYPQGGGGEKRNTTNEQRQTKKETVKPPAKTKKNLGKAAITNRYGIEMVWIPPGAFMMGADRAGLVEGPVHQVTISTGFYMGRYEVTQAQWQTVMGNNPSRFRGDNLPVENVSWDDAIAFVARLNTLNDGFSYRLPTEAEWEYACRAGTTGEHAGDLDSMAWYYNNSGDHRLNGDLDFDILKANHNRTHPVGTKLPNAFGLFDMHGNVWEWCQDWYDSNYYRNSPSRDPQGPNNGARDIFGRQSRVVRGGEWGRSAQELDSSMRYYVNPSATSSGYGSLGFRVVAIPRRK